MSHYESAIVLGRKYCVKEERVHRASAHQVTASMGVILRGPAKGRQRISLVLGLGIPRVVYPEPASPELAEWLTMTCMSFRTISFQYNTQKKRLQGREKTRIHTERKLGYLTLDARCEGYDL